MNIGLYDLDLCHITTPKPNLELMKVYNYHQLKGDKVTLMQPYESPMRFSHVYYFKESSQDIPRGVQLRPNNKTIYGEGFYGKFTPLPQPYNSYGPDPYIYLSRFNRYKNIKWEQFSEASIIRFANRDFTGVKDNDHMFIVDKNFCRLPEAEQFWQEMKQKKLHFLYALTIDDVETFERFQRFSLITPREFLITFKVTPDFLWELNKQKVQLSLKPYDNLTLMKLFLYLKHNNIKLNISSYIDLNTYQGTLKRWYAARSNLSFYDFCITNAPQIAKEIMNMPDELRMFAKTAPDSNTLDRLVF